MADINKNLKSICSFYASEWHLVTMLLPNLDQKINKGFNKRNGNIINKITFRR